MCESSFVAQVKLKCYVSLVSNLQRSATSMLKLLYLFRKKSYNSTSSI